MIELIPVPDQKNWSFFVYKYVFIDKAISKIGPWLGSKLLSCRHGKTLTVRSPAGPQTFPLLPPKLEPCDKKFHRFLWKKENTNPCPCLQQCHLCAGSNSSHTSAWAGSSARVQCSEQAHTRLSQSKCGKIFCYLFTSTLNICAFNKALQIKQVFLSGLSSPPSWVVSSWIIFSK